MAIVWDDELPTPKKKADLKPDSIVVKSSEPKADTSAQNIVWDDEQASVAPVPENKSPTVIQSIFPGAVRKSAEPVRPIDVIPNNISSMTGGFGQAPQSAGLQHGINTSMSALGDMGSLFTRLTGSTANAMGYHGAAGKNEDGSNKSFGQSMASEDTGLAKPVRDAMEKDLVANYLIYKDPNSSAETKAWAMSKMAAQGAVYFGASAVEDPTVLLSGIEKLVPTLNKGLRVVNAAAASAGSGKMAKGLRVMGEDSRISELNKFLNPHGNQSGEFTGPKTLKKFGLDASPHEALRRVNKQLGESGEDIGRIVEDVAAIPDTNLEAINRARESRRAVKGMAEADEPTKLLRQAPSADILKHVSQLGKDLTRDEFIAEIEKLAKVQNKNYPDADFIRALDRELKAPQPERNAMINFNDIARDIKHQTGYKKEADRAMEQLKNRLKSENLILDNGDIDQTKIHKVKETIATMRGYDKKTVRPGFDPALESFYNKLNDTRASQLNEIDPGAELQGLQSEKSPIKFPDRKAAGTQVRDTEKEMSQLHDIKAQLEKKIGHNPEPSEQSGVRALFNVAENIAKTQAKNSFLSGGALFSGHPIIGTAIAATKGVYGLKNGDLAPILSKIGRAYSPEKEINGVLSTLSKQKRTEFLNEAINRAELQMKIGFQSEKEKRDLLKTLNALKKSKLEHAIDNAAMGSIVNSSAKTANILSNLGVKPSENK